MPVIDTKEFHRLLKGKHRDLLVASSNREEIAIEITADEVDRLQQQLSREITIRNLDQTSKLIKNVQAALERIEDDVYGVCLRCETPIHERRLRAIPWASHCVVCQESIDRERTILDEDDGSLGFAA